MEMVSDVVVCYCCKMTTETMGPAQLAEYLGVTIQTVYRWRQSGYGPAYIQPVPGGRVHYRMDDVKEWESNLKRNGQ